MSIEIILKENASAVIQTNGWHKDSEGNISETSGKTIALCRCGASKKKPFCDGSHMQTDFKAPAGVIKLIDEN